MRHFIGLILLTTCSLLSCIPDFGEPISRLSGSRILAIQSEPAEVFPGEQVTLQLYAADEHGALVDQELAWALCTAPKPPVESRTISEACLTDGAQGITDTAQIITAVIPEDACARFGPELPPQGSGEPTARPRDADATGGYYQPVLAKLGTQRAVGLVRIRCGVASVTPEVAARFRREYVPNRNPFASTLRAEVRGLEQPLSALPADTNVTLKLSIPHAAQESFLMFDTRAQSLTLAEETLRVSWLSAQGQFSVAATSVLEGEAQSVFRTPSQPGSLLVWTVLRDVRGGVSVQAHTLKVRAE